MIRATFLAAIAGLSVLVAAGEAKAQKLEYDCDTTPEHYSELKLTQSGPAYAVTGSLSARRLYRGKRFAPIGSVNLSAADGSWSVRISLIGYATESDKVVTGQLRIIRNGKAEEPSLGVFEVGKPVHFALSLAADGKGSASLGGQTLPVAVQATGPVTASVVCSTGEFLFTDLDMGQ
jgi:hypothetical protein